MPTAVPRALRTADLSEAPQGCAIGVRAHHRHRGQTDDLPQDGGGRRRRRPARARIYRRRVPDEETAPSRLGTRRRHPTPRAHRQARSRPTVLDHLRRRYGGETMAVLGLSLDRPELREHLVGGLAHLEAEVVYAARFEMATCVDDVLSRRTRALLVDARSATAAAVRTAELLATELGWDAARAHEESAAFAAIGRHDLAAAASLAGQAFPARSPDPSWSTTAGRCQPRSKSVSGPASLENGSAVAVSARRRLPRAPLRLVRHRRRCSRVPHRVGSRLVAHLSHMGAFRCRARSARCRRPAGRHRRSRSRTPVLQ